MKRLKRKQHKQQVIERQDEPEVSFEMPAASIEEVAAASNLVNADYQPPFLEAEGHLEMLGVLQLKAQNRDEDFRPKERHQLC